MINDLVLFQLLLVPDVSVQLLVPVATAELLLLGRVHELVVAPEDLRVSLADCRHWAGGWIVIQEIGRRSTD